VLFFATLLYKLLLVRYVVLSRHKHLNGSAADYVKCVMSLSRSLQHRITSYPPSSFTDMLPGEREQVYNALPRPPNKRVSVDEMVHWRVDVKGMVSGQSYLGWYAFLPFSLS
jgi:hypothetical protein